MGTLITNERLTTETCCTCGVTFAMPEDLQAELRENKRSFYCPNGHSQHYTGATEADRLRDQLAQARRLQEQTAAARDRAQERAEQNEARRRAEKAAKTKLKKRIAAGCCPCCNRTFQNLAAHMATKHPDFNPDAEEQVAS